MSASAAMERPATTGDPEPAAALDPTPPVDPRRWQALLVLAAALLLIAIDNTVLNLALPSLARDLAPSATQLLWIIDAY